jgi:3-phosphoshikimate 1-carboxyvinyltransferase
LVSVRIRKSKIDGIIKCPSSKSYTHRAIAIASLTEKQSVIRNPLISRDTLATVAASNAFGVNTNYENSRLHVEGKHSFDAPHNVINAENSGTTIRIFAAISALVKKGFTILTGDASLRRRPMQPILDALAQLEVECYSARMNGTAPLLIRGGGIKGGTVILDGTISSQFLSSLLISSVYAKSPVLIRIKGQQVSKPYIMSTLATMKAFGVEIDYKLDFLEYYIRNKEYRATKFDVPTDFSTGALILSAGILAGGSLTLRDLNFSLPQGDSKILDIFDEMGAKVKVDKQRGEINVTGSNILEGGNFDLKDTPDLLPVVSILALKSRSTVRISGIAHARLKETDRVANIASQITKFGATVKEQNDQLLITAPKVLKNASIETFNDHRLFMAFSIASLLTKSSTVSGAESSKVSYPNFLQDLKALGADIELS